MQMKFLGETTQSHLSYKFMGLSTIILGKQKRMTYSYLRKGLFGNMTEIAFVDTVVSLNTVNLLITVLIGIQTSVYPASY